ncbi:uncharacterized protein LOC102722372 [Oryza brachyantha]|uniref:uncharacterized protein LOC102722372 n=1 Tax=Oryza brachyantha TaxID=4533 RepID=UPI001ADD38AD|nr:uncharacterized protein LOC102722372 [Oryza brachyantha]
MGGGGGKRAREKDGYYSATPAREQKRPRRGKQHLYVALDDWDGGYSIHRLDADDILDDQEPAARGVLHSIFVDANPLLRGDRAPPTFVYDAETAALAIGPRVPERLYDLGESIAVGDGETLYDVTSVNFHDASLHAMSWEPNTAAGREPWEPDREWSWSRRPLAQPVPCEGGEILGYALHPDGRTIFMSTGHTTHSLDTIDGTWKELGDWGLPFRGQAYFDADLDAWVGLHRKDDRSVCCCTVPSGTRPPRCKLLREKLSRRKEEDPKHRPCLRGRPIYLAYMGDSRFALVEDIPAPLSDYDDGAGAGAVLHVTIFGLKYDDKGELRTKVRRATRSYAVSNNAFKFSHGALFWM